jgi:prepilin-type processing-associated H-X9-DG protein
VTVPGGTRASSGGSSGGKTIMVVLAVCLLGFLVCGGGLAALLIPAMRQVSVAQTRMQCTNNLKQIGIALHNYHDTYKTFPPAYFADDTGQPMTSWRVMILPFLEQAPMYDQYDFDEPWDSPSNLALTSGPMPIYSCPSDPTGSCSYFVVNVPGSVFDGPKASRMADITDGTSNTIMVVEVTGSNVHWSQPQDLGPQAFASRVNQTKNGTCISSEHDTVANILMGDGSVHAIDEATANSVIQMLITKSDGQVVPSF